MNFLFSWLVFTANSILCNYPTDLKELKEIIEDDQEFLECAEVKDIYPQMVNHLISFINCCNSIKSGSQNTPENLKDLKHHAELFIYSFKTSLKIIIYRLICETRSLDSDDRVTIKFEHYERDWHEISPFIKYIGKFSDFLRKQLDFAKAELNVQFLRTVPSPDTFARLNEVRKKWYKKLLRICEGTNLKEVPIIAHLDHVLELFGNFLIELSTLHDQHGLQNTDTLFLYSSVLEHIVFSSEFFSETDEPYLNFLDSTALLLDFILPCVSKFRNKVSESSGSNTSHPLQPVHQ